MSKGPGNNLGNHFLPDIVVESELAQIAEDFALDFDIAYNLFQGEYDCIETMPDCAYEEYIGLEDLYAKIKTPSRLEQVRMNTLREVMQRYAETHRE